MKSTDKKYYNSKELYYGNIEYISIEHTDFGPVLYTSENKYIFEKIEKKGIVFFKEVFTGLIFNTGFSENKPYVLNYTKLNTSNKKISSLELLILLDKLNSEKEYKKEKKFKKID